MTKPTNQELIIESLRSQNTDLKTLLAKKNNELDALKKDFQNQSKELYELRAQLSKLQTQGRFQEKVKTLVS